MSHITDAAKRYLRSGLSVFPTAPGDPHQPMVPWKPLRDTPLTEAQVDSTWSVREGCGISVITGRGLWVWDFDRKDMLERFWAEAQRLTLVHHLVMCPVVRTPNGGAHLYYRVPGINTPSKALACSKDPYIKPNGNECSVLIEYKCGGGMISAPPTPGYDVYNGIDPADGVPTIPPDVHDLLVAIAISFDERAPDVAKFIRHAKPAAKAEAERDRVGSDFNARGGWEWLIELGCKRVGEPDHYGGQHWERMGKDEHKTSFTTDSSTTGGVGTSRIFSTSMGVEATYHDRFGLYAKLVWNGDFAAATRDLAAQGYGPKPGDGPRVVPVGEPWPEPTPFEELMVDPWPEGVLQGVLGEFVDAVAEATETPKDSAAWMALAAASAALQSKLVVGIEPGWEEPARIYTAVIMPPASRKSAVFKHTTGPLYDWQAREYERAGQLVAQYKADVRVAEEQLAAAITNQRKRPSDDHSGEVSELARRLHDLQAKPVAPTTLLTEDVTPERLIGLMQDNGGAIALLSADGAGVFAGMMGRYAKNGGTQLDTYLKAYSGDAIVVHRQTRGDEFVPNPAMTIGVQIQPSVVEGLMARRELTGEGLMARFCWAWPKSNIGTRTCHSKPVPNDLQRAWQDLLWGLIESRRRRVTLNPEQREELMAYQLHVESLLAPRGGWSMIPDWGGKAPGLAVRLSGLLWAAGGTNTTLGPAKSIVDYLASHYKRVSGASERAATTVSDLTRLTAWCTARKAPVTRREIMRGNQWLRDAVVAQQYIDELVDTGVLRIQEIRTTAGGVGRPAGVVYAVNPHA